MSGLLQSPDADAVKEEEVPTYVVEVAKSGRAECKKCDCKIENKNIRVGVIVEGEWGLFTRWQHLECTVFHKGITSVNELDGFGELDAKSKTAIQERFAESAGEVDEDAMPLDPDELVRKAWEQPLEPSPNLLMPLLPYQKEGLGWMTHQEQNDTHGGILADEMGMGKTIQAISLMLQNRPNMSDFAQLREWAASDARHAAPPSTSSSSSSSDPAPEMVRCGTLIVLPTVAIRQWQTEIARFTKEGSLTVKVYHGSDRNTSAIDLTKSDVVLTSYKILEIEYRKATAGTKVTCKVCNKKFYPDKLRVHRKYFCGESAKRTEAQALTQKKKARVTQDDKSVTKTKAGRTASSTSKPDRKRPSTATTTSGARRRRPSGSVANAADEGSEEEMQEEGDAAEEAEKVVKKPAAKGRGRASAAAVKVTARASAAKATSATKSRAGGRKTVTSDISDKDDSDAEGRDPLPPKKGRGATAPAKNGKKGAAGSTNTPTNAKIKTEIKIEPGVVTESVKSKKGKMVPASTPTATRRGRLRGSNTMPDINDSTSTSDDEGNGMDVSDGKDAGESSGSDIDAPPVTRKRTASAVTPVSGIKAISRGLKGGVSQVITARTPPATAATAVTPVRSSTRAAAQGKKKYTDDSDGSANEFGDLDSEYESPAASAEEDEEEEEGEESDVATDEDEEENVKSRSKKGKGTPAIKRTSAKSKPNKASVQASNGKKKKTATVKKGKTTISKVGSKRPAARSDDDDDDVAWESGSDASSSSADSSGDDEGSDESTSANKAEGSDSEVERDIQEALLEAANALRRSKTAPAVSVLHTVSWFRIILDEAHLIKDRSTSTAKAVFNLTSLNKWCLTGTPLQNRVGELYSLIRFLRIDPHAFYYCRTKGCCCKSLHYRFTKSYCDECNHSVIQHYCHFNKHILNPIKRSGYVADGRRAMLKLKQQVLDEILLRRTKTTRFEDIQLPPRIVTVRSERLDVKEEDFYSALYTQSQAQFNTYLQSGTVLNNYAHIFDILIRLRQAVDHPYLVIYSEAQTAKRGDTDNYLNLSNDTDDVVKIKKEPGSSSCCDLCHEPAEDPVSSASCEHSFCRTCISDYIGSVSGSNGSSGLRCPDCDQALTIQLSPVLSPNGNKSTSRRAAGNGRAGSGTNNGNLSNGSAQDLQMQDSASVWDASKGLSRKSILDKVDLNLFQSSTKIEALMEELHKMQSQDLGAKAIVFSQFVNMLDIISYRLQRGGLQCVKLSGSMGLEQRDKCITAFRTDPNIKVMLISLKAGGVALNLTVASRIFLMDPWWNPAAEMQAIDRTHRIGQHRPIYATRFIIENTIEERILRLQEKKKLVFDGTVGGDSGSMSKLTVDDMRFLFN